MILSRRLILGIIFSCSLLSSLAGATTRFDGNALMMPYLIVGDALYDVNLVYVENSSPLDFTFGAFSIHIGGTEVPADSALLIGNVLAIPKLQVNTDTYKVKLDFIEGDGVFRLSEFSLLLPSAIASR